MILQTLFDNPIVFVAWLIAIIIAFTVHEFSHALAGFLMGDETAKNQGRLTLNPISHVSGVGFLMLMLAGFGWGKPVPFNPLNFKYQFRKIGIALVSIAGPMSNLIMSIVGGIILKLIIVYQFLPMNNMAVQFLILFVTINIILMVFNLIPIAPLDGSKILYSFLHDPKYQKFIFNYEKNGPFLLVMILLIDNIFELRIFSGLFDLVLKVAFSLIA